MPRTCIICGAPANSREHIFPAALGGRRTNRGIYCEAHNNGFSGLAGVLTRQFGPLNAQLGVRDRDRRPRVVNLTTRAGDELTISVGQVRRANTSPVDPDAGIQFDQNFGGPDGLAALGYVALTFFAHHFGDAARQDGVAPIKAFIQGQAANEFVWWESEATACDLPANPFAFGHTLILTTAEDTGEARAIISLFQAFTYGVDLGYVAGATSRTITVFIDPHADREPADIQERASDVVEISIQKPEPMYAHLERMVFQGHGQDRIQGLQNRIARWVFNTEMEPVLLGLNAVRDLPVNERIRAIQPLVEEQEPRIYRLMCHAVRRLREHTATQPDMEPIVSAMAVQVELNAQRSALSEEAEIFFARVVAAFIRELSHKLGAEPLDMDYLWDLFSGGQGAHLAAQTMIEAIRAVINDPRSWEPDP